MADHQPTSNIKIYGPMLPTAIERLTKLATRMGDLGIPIHEGSVQMGKYDFTFFWSEEPSSEPLLKLVANIDDVLADLPTKYSLTTEGGSRTLRLTAHLERQAVNTIYTFVRVHGPRLLEAIRAIEAVVDSIETTNTLPSLKNSLIIGKYDFAFEWDHWPTFDEIHNVLEAIDKQVASTGALYKITTMRNIVRTDQLIDDHSSDNLMAFL